MANAMQVL